MLLSIALTCEDIFEGEWLRLSCALQNGRGFDFEMTCLNTYNGMDFDLISLFTFSNFPQAHGGLDEQR